MKLIAFSIAALFFAGCVPITPTSQPATLPTTAEQQAIDFALDLQSQADLANGVLQIVAAADPALLPYAIVAHKADAEIDAIVPQYVAAVENGSITQAQLLADIEADLSTILTSVSHSPAASARYLGKRAETLKK